VLAIEREYLDLVRRVIRDGQRRGMFRRVDPSIAAFSLFGMLNTLDGWYDPHGRRGPEALIADLEHLYLAGFTQSRAGRGCS
jgi:hypothetical protein